jgi:hypothetical protein
MESRVSFVTPFAETGCGQGPVVLNPVPGLRYYRSLTQLRAPAYAGAAADKAR